MFKSRSLIVASVMVCFAVMAMASSTAFAGNNKRMLRGNKKIIKRLDTVQQTLDDVIIPMLQECGNCPECPPCPGGEAGVPKTGQTTCYDASGTVIPCAGTGQDGEYQKGTPWPVPRFTDNEDGTVTDNLTGLIWLKDANCFGQSNWADALSYCNNLADSQCGLTDGSSAGDWRLPNRKELESLIHLGVYGPALPNTVGTGQWSEGDPFTDVQSNYWSATNYAGYPDNAWYVRISTGYVDVGYDKSKLYNVWPVRGGQ